MTVTRPVLYPGSPGNPAPYEALGDLVHDEGPVTINSSRGAVVCMDELTYTQLIDPPSATLLETAETEEELVHFVKLTTREGELLRAIATRGVAIAAIQCGLAANTVAQHLASVQRKYRVRTTAATNIIARATGQL